MNEIMTKNYLKKVTSSVLGNHLKELVWLDLEVESVESHLVEEAVKRLEKGATCITEAEYLENLDWAAKSYNAALRGKPVPCRGCNSIFDLVKLFRCYHCGSYFCPNCAREHFGKREESLHNAAMRANRTVAEVL